MLNRLTPRVRLLASFVLVTLLVLVGLRLAFWGWFLRPQTSLHPDAIWQSFLIGVRFDLRLALLAMLPVAAFSFLPGPLRLRDSRFTGVLFRLYVLLAGLFLGLFYIADFAHFAYLGERLNITVLEFASDQRDSMLMVWQTYPVVRLVLLVLAIGVLAHLFSGWLLRRYRRQPWPSRRWWQASTVTALCLALFVVGVLGKVSSLVPLRWSNAFFSGNLQVSALGLNPVLYFFDTLSNRSASYDLDVVRRHYPEVSRYLGVTEPDAERLNFVRQVPARADADRRPNVVFIHLESLGANRMGLFGNPMGATPYLDAIARRHSYFFPRFLVPASGTARTVFGLITGIPDVSWGGTTASRNPVIIDQYMLVNAFQDYQKLYFIGGDAGWANIRGLLQHNIADLELYEGKDYQAPVIDVWGVSDREVFKAAHARAEAAAEQGPFLLFIQTAGNHRPYTIPDDGSGFQVETPDMAELSRYTWQDHGQYNAARLLDFNIRFYLEELVKGSAYENNTIFVMYGDHNTRGTFGQHMGWSEYLDLDDYHVPLIIHAPGIIEDARELEVNASLPDLMPTVLSIIGLPYENRTVGRNLLDVDPDWNYVTVFGGDRSVAPLLGILGPDHYLRMYYNGDQPQLFELANPSFENEVSAQHPQEFERMRSMLEGLYETFLYMLSNNRP